jgi:hypothetical protein
LIRREKKIMYKFWGKDVTWSCPHTVNYLLHSCVCVFLFRRCTFYVPVSEMLNSCAAYRCWLLCLLLFISIIVNRGANKGSNDLLEASENKVYHLSSIL